jgi:hypothetical protein
MAELVVAVQACIILALLYALLHGQPAANQSLGERVAIQNTQIAQLNGRPVATPTARRP